MTPGVYAFLYRPRGTGCTFEFVHGYAQYRGIRNIVLPDPRHIEPRQVNHDLFHISSPLEPGIESQ